METNTKQRAAELRRRYFDATATPSEERELRRLLADTTACGAEFDDVRAVMAFFVAARPQAVRRPAWRRWAVAAAVVVALGAATVPLALRLRQPADVCLAYVGGQKITAPEQVMALVGSQIGAISLGEVPAAVDGQLSDMFNTLNESPS